MWNAVARKETERATSSKQNKTIDTLRRNSRSPIGILVDKCKRSAAHRLNCNLKEKDEFQRWNN